MSRGFSTVRQGSLSREFLSRRKTQDGTTAMSGSLVAWTQKLGLAEGGFLLQWVERLMMVVSMLGFSGSWGRVENPLERCARHAS